MCFSAGFSIKLNEGERKLSSIHSRRAVNKFLQLTKEEGSLKHSKNFEIMEFSLMSDSWLLHGVSEMYGKLVVGVDHA